MDEIVICKSFCDKLLGINVILGDFWSVFGRFLNDLGKEVEGNEINRTETFLTLNF